MKKLFYKTVLEDPKKLKEEIPHVSFRTTIHWMTIGIIAIVIVGVLLVQGKGFYDKISSSWDEVKFAYQKPSVVRTVREDYQGKQAELEQSFLKKEKSSEDKLVDDVVKRLEATQTLK